VPGIGNVSHTNHPQLNNTIGSLCKRALSIKEKNLIDDMGDGNKPSANIQNAVFNSTGKQVSQSTIDFITSYHRREVMNDSDFKDLFSDQFLSDLSSTNFIIH